MVLVEMLLSDSQLLGSLSVETPVKIISPDGRTHIMRFTTDTLVQHVKNCAVEFFYPSTKSSTVYKLVRVSDGRTLHEFSTIQQEQLTEQDELLLIERGATEAVCLWELGSVHAPAPASIAAATAGLSTPRSAAPHPDLQALLTTNELTKELQKILISLIESGARLAAGRKDYETTLRLLSEALDTPPGGSGPQDETSPPLPSMSSSKFNLNKQTFKRAECLQRFLEKFRIWRSKMAIAATARDIENFKELGFSEEETQTAFRNTGLNEPAAALWLVGERGSSIFELINGLPDGIVLQSLLQQPVIQRGLLNTRMLLVFISIVGRAGNATLWLNAPHGGPLLQQILRTYHSEKYCLAVNQYSEPPGTSRFPNDPATPSTSRQTR